MLTGLQMNLYIPQTRTCICFLGRGTAATAGENSSDPAFSLGCNDLAPEFPRVTFLLMKMREPHILNNCKTQYKPKQRGVSPGCSESPRSFSYALTKECSEGLLQGPRLNPDFFTKVSTSPSVLGAGPAADLRHPRGGYYITTEIVCV